MDRQTYGETNDCSVTALHIMTGFSYSAAHAALEDAGRDWRAGASIGEIRTALEALGWRVTHKWSAAALGAAMGHRRRLTTHSFVTDHKAWRQMPDLMVFTATHVAAFKGGLLRDWSESNALPITEAWEVARIGETVEPPPVIYL
jgi:hypothetical protein